MISVTILTKNSALYIARVLESLSSFDEVIVADTGSSDATVHIAQTFPNVSIHHLPFTGFGPTHNEASKLARHDWILSIDSDEIMTKQLASHIHKTPLSEECIYGFGRTNFYRSKHITGCGWHPDRVLRLYNRKKTSFSSALVHESLITHSMKTIFFPYTVLHYPYRDVTHFLEKMNSYTTLFAQGHAATKSSIWKAAGHALFAFIKSYFLQIGFLLGQEGFEIAWYNMNCAFYKYAKIRDFSNYSSSGASKRV